MNIPLWLAALPLWLGTLIIVGIPTALAMLGTLLIRRRIPLDRLIENNEVAGFKFAVLGVIYAVLLGFAVIVVWEKFRDAESAVIQEAGTALTLARLAGGLAPEPGKRLHDEVVKYLRVAIAEDWPAMASGRLNLTGVRAVDDLYVAVLADAAADPRGAAVQAAILTQLGELTEARRARIVLAQGVVPGLIWTVLSLGAVATVGFTFFFGTTNLRAQMLMTGLLAGTIFMGLMVVFFINRPFTGDISVGPEALQKVLEELSTDK